jgi:hypothetical protein
MPSIRAKQIDVDHSPSTYSGGDGTLNAHLSGIDGAIGAIQGSQRIETSDPGVTDDGNSGIQVGHRWLNTTAPSYWVCSDNTPGAAVWLQLG